MKNSAKVTLVGGSGFVGTNLAVRLAEQDVPFEIVDISPSQRFPLQYKHGDVRDVESLREAIEGDVVVNLAAAHRDDIRDKNEYYRTNVEGAQNIAKVCSEKEVQKIVFTSSVAVYGFAPPETGEAGEINPFNDYGRTKFQAEEVFRAWQSSGDNKLTIVRPTVIFGEGNRGNVYNLFQQIASGRFLMVGNGRNRKSMAYIGNVVAFLDECIASDEKLATYNYVDSPDLDMNTLVRKVFATLGASKRTPLRLPYSIGLGLGHTADLVSRLTGLRLPVSAIRVKKFCAETSFSSAKGSLRGFVAPHSLSEGIERTLYSEFIAPDPRQQIFYTE